jgi:hypothetical protein
MDTLAEAVSKTEVTKETGRVRIEEEVEVDMVVDEVEMTMEDKEMFLMVFAETSGTQGDVSLKTASFNIKRRVKVVVEEVVP